MMSKRVRPLSLGLLPATRPETSRPAAPHAAGAVQRLSAALLVRAEHPRLPERPTVRPRRPGAWTSALCVSAALLALAGCGSAAAPASSPAGSSASAPASSASAKPATGASTAAVGSAAAKPSGAGGSAAASPKPAASGAPASAAAKPAASGPAPEKPHLEVAIAASAGTYTPLLVAKDAGYFANHGLDVNINTVSASVGTQGMIAGKIDIYEGGAAAIAGHLAGADIIYAAATVDKSNLMLIGQKGITTVEGLKGKGVTTTSPGAFGDIAMRKTAKEHGLEVGKDIKLLFHPTPEAALNTFLTQPAEAGGIIITPPHNRDALNRGYPLIIDYYKEGLRIIGPGVSMTRDFYQKNPNTVKAYLESYLDGLKRSLDDPAYEKELDGKYGKITDQNLLDFDYQEGLKGWNKDMTVDPKAIQVVLDATDDPKAKTANPKDFYDNTIIQQVNKDYASKLFPNDVKA
jgi:NitT/TauT family transport system substrate-binding protein